MLTATITQPSFTYITLSFLLFNLILENYFLSLNVESNRFFLVLSFLGFFCFLVSCVRELLLLLFLFLLLYRITIGTITTIISNNVSKGKGTLKTSYKL
jgi:hypothetical protein